MTPDSDRYTLYDEFKNSNDYETKTGLSVDQNSIPSYNKLKQYSVQDIKLDKLVQNKMMSAIKHKSIRILVEDEVKNSM